jgi:hypothetical protein
MTLKFTLISLLVASTGQLVHAGFNTDCTDDGNDHYDNTDTKLKNYVWSDLSTCQRVNLGNMDANDIVIGGYGDGSINYGFDDFISIGSVSGGGCDRSDDCMRDCQVLCCLTDGCNYASIKRKKDVTDYIFYVETVRLFYCRMFSSGEKASSDSQSTCIVNRPPVDQSYCATMAASSSFGLSEETYFGLKSLDQDNSCSVTRKLQAGGVPTVTSIQGRGLQTDYTALKLEDVRQSIQAKLARFAKVREGLQNVIDENDGDTCKARKAISKKIKDCPDELLSNLEDDDVPGFEAEADDEAPSGKGKGGGMSKQAKMGNENGQRMGMGMSMGKGMGM